MNASVQRQRAPAPPLGVMASLTAGFEAVNAQLGLILLPLALDLLLWLGPRLSILPLMEAAARLLAVPATGPDAETVQPMLDGLRQSLLALGAAFNLFSVLSTAPLGVPSLMSARTSAVVPWGAAVVWPVDNVLTYLLLFGAFLLVGLFLGAVYFGGIAQQVRDARLDLANLARHLGGDWARLTALALLLVLVLFLLGAPTLVLAALVAFVSPLLGNIASVLGVTLLLWVLVFGGFTLHGIVLQRRGLFGSLWDSLRLVQSSLPQTTGLFVSVALINVGLGFVWNLPGDDSWFLIVGLAGHALVSTALVAATFVFYKDRYRWWTEMQRALRTGPAN